MLSEILEKFSEHRGAGSRWVQETQYEYRLNADGRSATVGGTIRGQSHRGKDKHAEYAGVFGGEVDEEGTFKAGGMKKYFKDEKGHEKVEAKGDKDPENFLEKLGLEKPKELENKMFPAAKGKSLTELEDVMEDLMTVPRVRKTLAK